MDSRQLHLMGTAAPSPCVGSVCSVVEASGFAVTRGRATLFVHCSSHWACGHCPCTLMQIPVEEASYEDILSYRVVFEGAWYPKPMVGVGCFV